MESFNDIKTLWHSDVGANLPAMADKENLVTAHTKKVKKINGIVIFLLFCCAAVLLILIAFAPFKMWSTYLGLIIFMAVAIYSIRLKIRRQHKF